MKIWSVLAACVLCAPPTPGAFAAPTCKSDTTLAQIAGLNRQAQQHANEAGDFQKKIAVQKAIEAKLQSNDVAGSNNLAIAGVDAQIVALMKQYNEAKSYEMTARSQADQLSALPPCK